MKKLNNSPELIIVAAGLIFASIIMLASLFYTPPASTATVIYSGKSVADNTESQSYSESVSESQTAAKSNNQESGSSSAQAKTQTVNINTADVQTLCTLSGIGEAKAQKIIDYRNSNGSFKSADEIMNVSGIGEKTYENIKDSITV